MRQPCQRVVQHRHHHAVEDDGHQDEVVEARILHQLDAVRAREALRRKHAQGLGVVLNGSGLDVAVVVVGGGDGMEGFESDVRRRMGRRRVGSLVKSWGNRENRECRVENMG